MKKTFLKNKKNVQFLIIGLGLIGGSIAKRLSKNGFKVLGLDSSKSTLNHAKNTEAVKGSVNKIDFTKKLFVIVALPPKTILRGFNKYLDLFQKADFITDCTSVKESLLSQIKKNNLQKKFLLSHPIAGSEKSGFLNSNENLFEDKVSIVLKHKGISENALQISQEFWSELGSKTFNLDSKFHDRIFSLTSHIPHIVAFSLISLLSKRKDLDYKKFMGGGFKDFTRIAASDPKMWENIFTLNKKNILKDINRLQEELNTFKKLLLKDEQRKIESYLKKIKKTKESLNK